MVSTQLYKAPQNSKAMQMAKLTKKFVNSVPFPEKGQMIFRDERMPGFGLRVTPGSKTYVVEARVHGVARRITLGKVGTLLLPPLERKLSAGRR
jgi:hypothetical protein